MEVFDAARTVLAIRDYLDKPVPSETIRRVVESAWLTGSSMNGQPWHFIVVQDRSTLRKLGSMARSGPYIAKAAFAVVVATEQSRYAVSDGSRAIQSMMLTAWSEGVGSNWVGFQGPNEIRPVLGIPESMNVLAIVPFGYPVDGRVRGKKRRKALAQVAHRERFGQPFE